MTEGPGYPPIADYDLGGGGPWTRVSSMPGPAGTTTDRYTSPTGGQLRVFVAPAGTYASIELVAAADRAGQVTGGNVAGIHSRGVASDGSVWVAVDDYGLPSVSDLSRVGERLDPESAYRAADAVLGVLDSAQTAGTHGLAVSPETVHIAAGATAPVVDLLTVASDPARGTIAYYPDGNSGPSVVPGQAVAVGGVLYALLTGRPGTVGAPPPSAVLPGLDRRFDAVPMRALSTDPSVRYQTLSAMRADVASTLASVPAAGAASTTVIPAVPAAAAEPPGETSGSSGRVWAAVAIVALVALVGLGLWWFLSRGSTVAVPNVVGQQQAAAQQQLTAAGFTVGTVSNVSSDRAVGTVVTQDPAAGAQAKQGSTVNLQLSGGPTKIAVPSVIGMTQSQATNELIAAKLTLGTVKQVASNQPLGTVIAQSPNAGTEVTAGAKVDLQVSTGQVAVPNVVGQTQAVASANLSNAGFQVSVETTTSAPAGSKAGNVVAQDPKGGTPLNNGGTVVITVFQPAPSPTTESPTPTPTSTPTPTAS